WRNVADEIEIEIVVQRRTNQIACGDQKERIAVGGGTHDRLCADVGTCSRPVLDDKWLAESLQQPLSDQAREDVRRIARRPRYNNARSWGGIRLCPSNGRDRRQRRSAGGQMQEFAAEKFHLELPSRFTSFDHLVGARGQSGWNFESEGFGGLEVDYEFEFGGLIDRQVGGRRAIENAPHVDSRAAIIV